MNHNKFLLILISFCLYSKIFCQSKSDSNLYFVMVYSTDLFTQQNGSHSERDSSFLGILWRLEKDTLISVDTLNFDYHLNNEFTEVRHFDEYKCIFIKEEERRTMKFLESLPSDTILPESNIYISVFDYGDNNLVIRKMDTRLFEPFFDKCNSNQSFVSNDTLYFEYSRDPKDNFYGNYVISKFMEKGFKLDEKIYLQNKYARNEPALYSRGFSGFPFSKQGKLVFDYNKETEFSEWKPTVFQVPHSNGDGIKYAKFTINYETPMSKYLIGQKHLFGGAVDKNMYYILNKENEKWDSFYLPSGSSVRNIYKNEFVVETMAKACNWPKCNYLDSIDMHRIKYKDKYTEKYGYYPNYTWTIGKFIIYHIPSKKLIEYQAKDRDCEIIQIIDDWIYYRVYDELRRMKINTDKVDFEYNTDELLYKDKDIIPNVHHIFWAKKQPLKVEWITPKPEKKKDIKVKVTD